MAMHNVHKASAGMNLFRQLEECRDVRSLHLDREPLRLTEGRVRACFIPIIRYERRDV